MMPFAFIVGILTMAFITRRDKQVQPPNHPTPVKVKGSLDLLNECVACGREVPDWLVSDAIAQAYDDGNISLALDLADIYDSPAFEKQAESVNADSPSEALISPLKGVSDSDWTRYVESLKTGGADDAGGYFHFNKDRISKLGFDSLGDYSQQVAILVADTLDNLKRGKSFLDNVGSTVEIDGKSYVASASGLLAVLKAAGPSAAKWLASDDDKIKFPKTTALFVRANDCF